MIGGLQLLPGGVIGWYYIRPEWRGRRLGIPPMGQAVQRFRAQGLDELRLHCADEELRGFFEALGFAPGEGDEMVKYIGFRERETL